MYYLCRSTDDRKRQRPGKPGQRKRSVGGREAFPERTAFFVARRSPRAACAIRNVLKCGQLSGARNFLSPGAENCEFSRRERRFRGFRPKPRHGPARAEFAARRQGNVRFRAAIACPPDPCGPADRQPERFAGRERTAADKNGTVKTSHWSRPFCSNFLTALVCRGYFRSSDGAASRSALRLSQVRLRAACKPPGRRSTFPNRSPNVHVVL